jgi:hypothetical protein
LAHALQGHDSGERRARAARQAQRYAALRKPYLINDMAMQDVLLDRRRVYQKLQARSPVLLLLAQSADPHRLLCRALLIAPRLPEDISAAQQRWCASATPCLQICCVWTPSCVGAGR